MTRLTGKQALPHRPHLDHLRKQAKARLAEMRVAQPTACLADAQFALAQDYGFSSWGALRAEVFRQVTAARGNALKSRQRKAPRAIRYRERERLDALVEQTAHGESHTAFFLAGAATNVGVLFVLIAILMSLWVFSSALPG